MSETLAEELELADMAEETQLKEQAMRITMKKLLQDIVGLEATTQSEKEERQKREKQGERENERNQTQ